MADSEPEPQSVDTDGLVCWVCQFVDCEGPEEPLPPQAAPAAAQEAAAAGRTSAVWPARPCTRTSSGLPARPASNISVEQCRWG